jgi:integrase
MIIETLLYTGIRRIELTQLKRTGIYETHILVEQGKGQKDRIIYIPKTFAKQLKDWLEIQKRNMEYVFCDN